MCSPRLAVDHVVAEANIVQRRTRGDDFSPVAMAVQSDPSNVIERRGRHRRRCCRHGGASQCHRL
jgi:hypothetical protein